MKLQLIIGTAISVFATIFLGYVTHMANSSNMQAYSILPASVAALSFIAVLAFAHELKHEIKKG